MVLPKKRRHDESLTKRVSPVSFSGDLPNDDFDQYRRHCIRVVRQMEFVGQHPEEQRRLTLEFMLEGHLGIAHFKCFDYLGFQREFMVFKDAFFREYVTASKGKGRLTSAYDTVRFLENTKKFPKVRAIVEELLKKFIIKNAWVLFYILDGFQARHSDRGYHNGWRLLQQLFDGSKTFSLYTPGNVAIKFKVEHGMAILMSDKMGGVDPSFTGDQYKHTNERNQHSGDSAAYTGFIGFDLCSK